MKTAFSWKKNHLDYQTFVAHQGELKNFLGFLSSTEGQRMHLLWFL
jgi:hypothetical protein